MTQPNQQRSLLTNAPYRNPRHAEEAAEVEALEAANGQPGSIQPEHNWEKRYKDLQSFHSKSMNEMKSQVATLQQQGVQKLTVPKTAEEMAAFKAQNPETFSIIETMAANISQAHMKQYDQQLATINGDLMETKIERAVLEITKEHPDYKAIINDDLFHQWASQQTQAVQDWVYNNPDEPSLASKALSLFKFESGWGQTNSNPKGVRSVQGNDSQVKVGRNSGDKGVMDRNHPAYIWSEQEIKAMRPQEFGQWEKHIDLAMAEGRITR